MTKKNHMLDEVYATYKIHEMYLFIGQVVKNQKLKFHRTVILTYKDTFFRSL